MADNSEIKSREKNSRRKRKRALGREGDGESKRQKPNGDALVVNGEHHSERKSKKNQRKKELSLQVNGTLESSETGSRLPAAQPTTQAFGDDGPASSEWTISKPLGGRMVDVDPILTRDEQHLIILYSTSVQVFSAADSHLVRRISFDGLFPDETNMTVITAKLSVTSPELVWVACPGGLIVSVDWTKGTTGPKRFHTRRRNILDFDVITSTLGDSQQDILVVSESTADRKGEVILYETGGAKHPKPDVVFSPDRSVRPITIIQSSPHGDVIIGAAQQALVVLVRQPIADTEDSEAPYKTYVFDTADTICALDVRISAKTKSSKGTKRKRLVVNVIAGGARGAIYRYDNILHLLEGLSDGVPNQKRVQSQIHHWHRRAVHALKWSRDGNYVFSGGSENTLVLWQMDTGKREFLPHLSGSIENIVVSTKGSSLAVHLDDNSTMILSTTELKPTAYVSGLQSAVVSSNPKDALVSRVWEKVTEIKTAVPTAVNPVRPNWLHLCVGAGMQATTTGNQPSAPLLQTFDLESFTSVSKQALARTQPTDVNITSEGHPIAEPRLSHLAFSHDGQWLATVDEWSQPLRDIESTVVLGEVQHLFEEERVEVYLKFWQATSDGSFALVSRINSPHITTHPEPVFDLATDQSSTRFATIGNDGAVRIWRSKIRRQDGVVVKEAKGTPLRSWSCMSTTYLRNTTGSELVTSQPDDGKRRLNGSLAFSEDGSILFAAFGTTGDGRIYVIDALSGELTTTLDDMWRGDIISLRVLSPYIIIVSDKDLRVYDVVADDLRYGMDMPGIPPQLVDFTQLAVDFDSRTFAVVTPQNNNKSGVVVFSPDEPYPLFRRQSLRSRVLSITSAVGSSGYIILDDAAQLSTITKSADPLAVSLAQPLEQMKLDTTSTEQALEVDAVMINSDDAEEDSDEDDAGEDGRDEEDDDMVEAVVNQDKLAEIFDAGPAFAMPSMEDMFFKVTSLIVSKPLVQASLA